MKKLKNLALAGALVSISAITWAARVIYNQTLVSETALAYNNTYLLDMGVSRLSWSNIDSLSMQAVYSSATVAAVSFIDGTKSTATITVKSFNGLDGVQSTADITVLVSTTNLAAVSNLYFTLNGYMFAQGDLWSIGASTGATGQSIANAINNYSATNATFIATTSSNSVPGVVKVTVLSTGTQGNNYLITTSSSTALRIQKSTTLASANFTGGVDHGFLVVAGTALTEATDFNAVTSSHVTAGNIVNAIANNSALSSIIAASTTSTLGVVYATSTAVGSAMNYSLWASTPALTISNQRFYGGTDSNIVSSVFTKANHNLTTGLAVLLASSAGTAPQNLAVNTTYYAIRVNSTQFKLASSAANATAGTSIVISTVTGSGSFTLTPLALTGTPSFKWQGSNDNSNWNDVSVSSVTMTSLAPAVTTWDFGSVNYRYIRLNFVAPTTGGVSLVVNGIGKSN